MAPIKKQQGGVSQGGRSTTLKAALSGAAVAAGAIAVLGVGAKQFIVSSDPGTRMLSGDGSLLATVSGLFRSSAAREALEDLSQPAHWVRYLPVSTHPTSKNEEPVPQPVKPLGAGPHVYTHVHHVDPRDLAYIPPGTKSRKFSEAFVPHDGAGRQAGNVTIPAAEQTHFQVYDRKRGDSLLGGKPRITLLAKSPNTSYHFAHEAPVWLPGSDSIYWCSNAGAGGSDLHRNNVVYKFRHSLSKTAVRASRGQASYKEDIEEVPIDSPEVQMTNGGTNYGPNLLLFANQGRGPSMPGGLTLVTTPEGGKKPRVKTLVNNVRSKHFNAPNDVVVHPTTGQIFFTDALYAQLQHFKDKADLPTMLWAFDPPSGRLAPLETNGVDMPNGLCFDPEGKKLYVTDTAAVFGARYAARADVAHRVIYVFDVVTEEDGDVTRHFLANRRVFAHVDTGIADGIKTDDAGNVYAGTGDGIDVWSSKGTHLVKIFLPWGGAPNFVLAGKGRIVALSDVRIWLIEMDEEVRDPGLAQRPAKAMRVAFDD
ncbi:calcium-dependent phosphotriesterase [Jaminaea rosea]|uniref:Calcium-dependent phosphotriesterase n=1 Tax=Jaminaea rosea TaxID=1569628 RepID=A0A316UTZ7_9BASI|nr:calcium-dependent phosphotriesterase [Jaminaea rosea]PWN27383.1 calcium-dependent phosphotriesterase [Jaminaea rosea]